MLDAFEICLLHVEFLGTIQDIDNVLVNLEYSFVSLGVFTENALVVVFTDVFWLEFQ